MSSSKGTVGPNNSCVDHTFVAHPSLVPNLVGIAGGLPSPPATGSGNYNTLSQLQLSNSGSSSSTGRLEGLRQRFRVEKISDQAIDLILSSWRDKTNTNYNLVWKSWESWCTTRGLNPFSTDISNVLDFLAEKFHAGLKYRSLNCYRSALSSALLPIDGFQVGQHPLVIRLLKGILTADFHSQDILRLGMFLKY